MRLTQFEYLAALQKYGSISKAAEALYVSQPAISSSIKELEQELSFQILVRSNRGTSFTPNGLKVVESASLILDEIDKIKRLADRGPFSDNRMSIASPFTYAGFALIPLVTELSKKRPNLMCDIRIGNGPSLVDQLLKRTLDFGLIYIGSISPNLYNELVNKEFRIMPLIEEPLLFCCRHHHPLSGKKLRVSDLFNYPYLTMYDLPNSEAYNFLKTYGYDNKAMRILEPSSARSMLTSSDAFTTESYIALQSGNTSFPSPLDYLDVEDFDQKITLALVYHKSRPKDIADFIGKNVVEHIKCILRRRTAAGAVTNGRRAV